MRQTLRDSHLTENGGPSVYRFLAVARRPPRPELVIYLGERPGPADAVLVWGRLAGVNYLSDRPRRGAIGFVRPLLDPPNTELRRQYRCGRPQSCSLWVPIKTAGGPPSGANV